MIINGPGGGLLDLDAVAQVHGAALLAEGILQSPGCDGNHQGAELRLVQGIMADPLLKDHLRIQGPAAGQRNDPVLRSKGGMDPLQARQFAFLIADLPSRPAAIPACPP